LRTLDFIFQEAFVSHLLAILLILSFLNFTLDLGPPWAKI
jgi:hypothetical protein